MEIKEIGLFFSFSFHQIAATSAAAARSIFRCVNAYLSFFFHHGIETNRMILLGKMNEKRFNQSSSNFLRWNHFHLTFDGFGKLHRKQKTHSHSGINYLFLFSICVYEKTVHPCAHPAYHFTKFVFFFTFCFVLSCKNFRTHFLSPTTSASRNLLKK